MTDSCACWPPPERMAEFIGRARAGEPGVPVVGDGSPETEIGCAHGSWTLAEIMPEPAPDPEAGGGVCSETTKAGDACQGRAGPDGLCAAHKKAAAADGEGG